MTDVLSKRCTRCKEIKPLSEFYVHRGRKAAKDGHQNQCIPCASVYAKEYRADPERHARVLASNRRHYWANRERLLAEAKAYCEANPEKRYWTSRRSIFKRKYGITLEEYDQLLVSQGGVCEICKQPPDEASKGVLHVDHDHETGGLRSLLCTKCNSGIGLLGDDPARMRAAADYVDLWRAMHVEYGIGVQSCISVPEQSSSSFSSSFSSCWSGAE